MKYFVTEEVRKASHSTCFFEFQKGYYHDRCWLDGSISIRDTLWEKFSLSDLFRSALDEFDAFGITVITKKQWEEIVKIADQADPIWREVVEDAASWVTECFAEYEVFSILGM